MEYSINVVLTDKDYDEFDEFTMKHVPETKRMIRVARWSFVAVVAVAASFPLFAGDFAASAFATPLEFVQWLAFIKTKCTSVTQY